MFFIVKDYSAHARQAAQVLIMIFVFEDTQIISA
jgi:hypothetical protein